APPRPGATNAPAATVCASVIVVLGSESDDRLSHVAARDTPATPKISAAAPKVGRMCRGVMARIIIPATFEEAEGMTKGIRTSLLGVGGMLAATTAMAQAQADAAKIARGKYLMTIGACNDCHSPKIDPQQHPDPKRPFSGRPQTTQAPSQNAGEIHASLDLTAWSGPWGISYGANLSPDPETGLAKRYTEASFIKTLRTGKKPEGEDLL